MPDVKRGVLILWFWYNMEYLYREYTRKFNTNIQLIYLLQKIARKQKSHMKNNKKIWQQSNRSKNK